MAVSQADSCNGNPAVAPGMLALCLSIGKTKPADVRSWATGLIVFYMVSTKCDH